jgi:hypothetical protein
MQFVTSENKIPHTLGECQQPVPIVANHDSTGYVERHHTADRDNASLIGRF